jgi:hypothetical protein
MKRRGTFILLAILAGLLAYYYFVEIKGGQRKQEAKEKSEKLLTLEQDEIQTITLIRPQDTVVLERADDDGWRMSKPLQTDADASAVDDLLSALANAKAERDIDTQENLAGFGLEPPKYTVIVASKEQETDTLRVGHKNPTDRYLFVLSSKKPGVVLTGTQLETHLDKDVFAFRDKSVLRFQKEDVSQIELQRKGMENIRISRQGDAWQIVSPLETQADRYAVDNLVNRIYNAKAARFEAEAIQNREAYGLRNPWIKVTLTLEPEKTRKRLLIGKQKETNRFYAYDTSREPVFTVDTMLVAELKKRLFDIRDKTVATFERDSVRTIEIMYEDTLTLAFQMDDEDAWWLSSPVEAKAIQWKVTGILSDIAYLKATSFVGQVSSGLARYGLENPQIDVFLKDAGTKTLARVKIGHRAGEGDVYVMNVLTHWIYKTEDNIIGRLTFDIQAISETEVSSDDSTEGSS